jgi:hypothetical protein
VIIGEPTALNGAVLDAINTAVRERDVRTLQEYVSLFPGRVKLNESRQAVQILGCSGTVRAHMPASSELLASLAPPR